MVVSNDLEQLLWIWPASPFPVASLTHAANRWWMRCWLLSLCFSFHRGDITDVTKNPSRCDVLACGFSPL